MNSVRNPAKQQPDGQNINLTFSIAVVGIAAVLIAFGAALWAFHGTKNPGEVIPAVLGAVTAAIGTLAGLVAGHAAGAAGKAQSDQRASDNERDAVAGRALAQTMLADKPARSAQGASEPKIAATTDTAPDSYAQRHADLAQRLFPDLS